MSAPRKARVVVFGFAQLAAISHKLNRDDLAQMMVVGVALYQQGLGVQSSDRRADVL